MKKKAAIVLLPLASGLLLGCAGDPASSSTPASSSEPPSSSSPSSSSSDDGSISRDEMIKELGKAYYHFMSAEKLGIDLTSGGFSYDEKTYAVSDGVRGEVTSSWFTNADAINVSLDAEGLQSEGGLEAKAALSADVTGFNLKYEGIEINELTGHLAAYLSESTLYADVSDEKVGEVFTQVTGLPSGKLIIPEMFLSVGEYLHYLPEFFGHDQFGGELDPSGSTFVDFLNENIDKVSWVGEVLDGCLDYKKNPDGTYLMSGSVESVEAFAALYAEAAGIDVSIAIAFIEDYFDGLDFQGLSISVGLDAESRLTDVKLSGTVSHLKVKETSSSVTEEEEGTTTTSSEPVTPTVVSQTFADLSFDFGFGIRYEDEVAVTLPDLSEYTNPFPF